MRTQNSQPAVNLSHTLWRWFYLHSHPPPPPHPVPPLLLLDLFLGGKKKKRLMIFWYIFLFMLFWGVCAGESFFSLRDALWFGGVFWSREFGGSLTQEDFLGDQTRRHRHNFLSCLSRRAVRSSRDAFALLLNMSVIPHHDVQLTSFDWELLIPLH